MDETQKDLFNSIVNEIYSLDSNCSIIGEDFDVDLQGSSHYIYDNASRPLFWHFNEETILTKPTYKTFIALLDNYISNVGQQEEVNREEVQENIDFINAITDTDLVKKFHELLIENDLFQGNFEVDFRRYLYITWFRLYSRNYESRKQGILDSSAFEHTFVGETKESKGPIGFHNWLRLYLLEKSGELDYEGHVKKATKSLTVQVRFNWQGNDKVSSIFLGTSPEFEVCVYTLGLIMARKCGQDEFKIPFEIDGEEYSVQIYCKSKWSEKHKMRKVQLESAYPI